MELKKPEHERRLPITTFGACKRQALAEMKLKTPEIFKDKVFIGEGTFGKVYKAKIGETLYALKKIKIDGIHKP